MRSLAFALALVTATGAAAAPAEEPIETPISVPSPIPIGFLVAWKPMILSVRLDTGTGPGERSKFGSDKLQLYRALFRYTTTMFEEKLLARAEFEGGTFTSDTQNQNVGSDGYDWTARLLAGTATRISPVWTITASGGLITRYQTGRAVGGAPRIGMLGVISNIEFEYRVAPMITLAFFLEGGLTPIPYRSQTNLGELSDASELRSRLQVSIDIGTNTAIDIGYDFTRWHASFAGTTVLGNPNPDQALMIEAREHAMTLGVRWKP